MKNLSRRSRPLAAALGAAGLLTLAGCATPPDRTSSASSSAPRTAWHDPDFYTPWHDPKAIVLPPPPFTGFSSTGKITPMLPGQPRPTANTPVLSAPAP